MGLDEFMNDRLADRERAVGESEPFWVIERFENGRSGGYWNGQNSRTFTNKIDDAIQFRRERDAQPILSSWHWTDCKIVEHSYFQRTPAPVQPFPVDKTDEYESRIDAAKQPVQPGVVEAMADAINAAHTDYHPCRSDYLAMATAALAAARPFVEAETRKQCAEEMLAEPTREEVEALNEKYGYFQFGDGQGTKSLVFAEDLFASRRKRLSQPVETLHDRVEECLLHKLGSFDCAKDESLGTIAAEIIALVRKEQHD